MIEKRIMKVKATAKAVALPDIEKYPTITKDKYENG